MQMGYREGERKREGETERERKRGSGGCSCVSRIAITMVTGFAEPGVLFRWRFNHDEREREKENGETGLARE